MAGKPKRLLFDAYPTHYYDKPIDEEKRFLRRMYPKLISPNDLYRFSVGGWYNNLIIDQYVEDGGDIDATIERCHHGENYSLLHFSIGFTDYTLIKRLIYHGVNVNAVLADNTTPICIAIYYKCVHIVDLLLKAGADTTILPNEENRQYSNLIEMVLSRRSTNEFANKRYEEIADLLYEHEANKLDVKSARNKK